MTRRVIANRPFTLSYDAENRLVSVSGPSLSASVLYDGDGNRVRSAINGTTTTFVGSHYEVSGSTVTKYYYAGAQRIAMNVDGTVYYLLSDHLGSTSITTNSSGGFVSELRYDAWGSVRYTSGATPADYTYTGQYSNVADFGLMFYNARWYDPAIARFAQADTIVPDGAQGWDRYAYGLNNPSRYRDPSGHYVCEGTDPCTPSHSGSVGGGGQHDHDSATPVDVGLEWLTGIGSRNHYFQNGDPFTELLQQHEHLAEVRRLIAERILAGDYDPHEENYYLGGWQGVPKYAADYSTLVTFGHTGNLAVTYLGSYNLEYDVIRLDSQAGTAVIQFRASNESTLASATHPPVIGYTDFWERNISTPINNLVPSGPMSRVTQTFVWTETIYYKGVTP